MNNEIKKEKFIEKRIRGETLDSIAKTLKVTKQTLINCNKEPGINETISLARLTKYQSLIKEYQSDCDRLMTFDQFADYLPEKPQKSTIYGWVCARRVPYEKLGKNLYFRKSDIDKWQDNGRRIII